MAVSTKRHGWGQQIPSKLRLLQPKENIVLPVPISNSKLKKTNSGGRAPVEEHLHEDPGLTPLHYINQEW